MGGRLKEIHESNCKARSDIYQHLPTLRRYADMCNHITEFGIGYSTYAFLSSKAEKVFSYDLITPQAEKALSYDILSFTDVKKLQELCRLESRHWEFKNGDSRKVDIKPTDLLFIDTHHYYQHLKHELARNGQRAMKYIIMHDTQIYKYHSTQGRDSARGLMTAIEEYIKENPEWFILEHYPNCNGLTILSKR